VVTKDETAEITEVIRAAFNELQGLHPEVLSRISSAIESARGHDSEIQEIEVAFRDAAKSLVPTHKSAAQTLFQVAETLAEIANYWGLPGSGEG
jgi:hypothetical protein